MTTYDDRPLALAVATAIEAAESLRRLEEARDACRAAERALNLLGPDDVPREHFDAVLATFDQLLELHIILAPRIKQKRAIIRAAKRRGGSAA